MFSIEATEAIEMQNHAGSFNATGSSARGAGTIIDLRHTKATLHQIRTIEDINIQEIRIHTDSESGVECCKSLLKHSELVVYLKLHCLVSGLYYSSM